MAKSYVRTAGGNDTTALLLKKIDELLAAHASLKASHAAMATKLNADSGVADTNYADASSANPSTAASELM